MLCAKCEKQKKRLVLEVLNDCKQEQKITETLTSATFCVPGQLHKITLFQTESLLHLSYNQLHGDAILCKRNANRFLIIAG